MLEESDHLILLSPATVENKWAVIMSPSKKVTNK